MRAPPRLPAACLAALAACGGSSPAPTRPAPAGAALPLWLEGDWIAADGAAEHWRAAGGALFGVGFPTDGLPFEVMIVAPAPGAGARFTAWPAGDGGVTFAATERGPAHVVFANPAHDFPREVAYRRDGDALAAWIGPGGGAHAVDYAWRAAPSPASAPELEAADRAFAADTARAGAAGWAAWFDPEGAQWRPGRGRVQGPEAIRALMRPAFDERGLRLEWTPRASGLAPRGDLGFTIGDYLATPREGEASRGGYVTIWRRQADGSWKVLFDVGT